MTPVAKAKTNAPVSTDTLESVMAIEGQPSFTRLAAWMMQASEPEIAAYWQFYRQQKNRSNDINDLIFINWTRLDPQAAIAASTGTPDEHYAWWAWACHDPKQALATVIATRPDKINNVAWGLGEFHAQWVMEHFQEIPEKYRANAIRGMTKWDDSPDPKRILDFLREKGEGFNQGMFKSLVRKDPWEAYEWLQANRSAISNYGPGYAISALVDPMKDSPPEMLEQFASRLPVGDLKRRVEGVLFESLAASDPDQALAQASATKSSAVAADRFATLALALSKTDPGRAWEVAKQMFETNPGALSPQVVIAGPGSLMSYDQFSDSPVLHLVDRLLTIDPAALMEMQSVSSGSPNSSSFDSVATKWAAQDFPAYAEWVNRQTVPEIREQAAGVVISQLRSDAHYEEAIEWAMSSEKLRQTHLFSLMVYWQNQDPEGAGVWLESAPLTESERANFEASKKQ